MKLINKISLYFEFGMYLPFRVIGLYIIPMLIVSDKFLISFGGIFAAISLNFASSLLYMVNTYLDRDIDKIAHPERLLPSNKVSLKEARIYMIITLGLFFASLLLINNYMIRIILIVIIAFYIVICSMKHSKYNSNLLFGIIYGLTAPTFTGLFFYIIGYSIINKHDFYLALMSTIFFILDVAHDLYGFILDKNGDDSANIKTLLDICGEKITYFFIVLCDIASVIMAYYYISKLEIVEAILIGVIMSLFVYNMFISNYKAIRYKEFSDINMARTWQSLMTYGLGLILFIKFRPMILFSTIGIFMCFLMLFKAGIFRVRRKKTC